ncbi:putative P-type H(+)-exporting transporter [Helianthus annuus]|nr:putative P-type H(+)-exporting transporter [Helianthus annuus]
MTRKAHANIQELQFLPFNSTSKWHDINVFRQSMHRVNSTKILNLAHTKSDIEHRVHAAINKFADLGLRLLAVAHQLPWNRGSTANPERSQKMSWNGTNMYPSSALLGQDKDESIVALLVDEVIENAYDFAVVFPGLQRKCFSREMGVQEEVGDGCKTNCFRGWNKWWLKKVILMESDDSMCPSKSRAMCGGPPRTPLSPPLFTLSEQVSRSCSKAKAEARAIVEVEAEAEAEATNTAEALVGVIGAFLPHD